jgi:AbrB family looped-hinge helix DNA binding protein
MWGEGLIIPTCLIGAGFVGMSIVDLDERGRLTIPSEIRRRMNLSGSVLVINAGDHIKVLPLPEDPFMVLEGALSLEAPFRDLRARAVEEAQREAAHHASP